MELASTKIIIRDNSEGGINQFEDEIVHKAYTEFENDLVEIATEYLRNKGVPPELIDKIVIQMYSL